MNANIDDVVVDDDDDDDDDDILPLQCGTIFHLLSGNQAHYILSKDASSPTFSITISTLPLATARASDSSLCTTLRWLQITSID